MNAPAPKPVRSPSYPNLPLREAIEKVGKIERLYRYNPLDRALAAKSIGYSMLSGPASSALAALAAYGLLESAGKGETKVTDRARDILYAPNDGERKKHLFAAAMEPELFRELRERFSGIPVPPEEGVVNHLNRQGFNPNAVRPAAKAFLQTMSYLQELGVTESNRVESEKPQNAGQSAGDKPGVTFGGAEVGDLVQWEVDGSLKLEKATRVRAVQEHDGKQWVFVEGSETGISMEQIVVEQKGAGATPASAPPTLALNVDAPTQKGARREVFALDEGDVVLTFPDSLSSESFSDLEDYLKVFLKKAKRKAQAQKDADGDPA